MHSHLNNLFIDNEIYILDTIQEAAELAATNVLEEYTKLLDGHTESLINLDAQFALGSIYYVLKKRIAPLEALYDNAGSLVTKDLYDSNFYSQLQSTINTIKTQLNKISKKYLGEF